MGLSQMFGMFLRSLATYTFPPVCSLPQMYFIVIPFPCLLFPTASFNEEICC